MLLLLLLLLLFVAVVVVVVIVVGVDPPTPGRRRELSNIINIDSNAVIQVTEKFDGTFVIVFRWNGELQVCTKRRFDSEQVVWTRSWIKQNWSPEQIDLLTEGSSYLFEAIYPNNRVVIDYNFEGFLLVGAS